MILRRLRSAEDWSRRNIRALIGLELRHLHLCAAHDRRNLVKRLRPQRQLFLQRRLPLRVLERCRCLRLIEPLPLHRRTRLRLLQRRLLVLREGSVIQTGNVHILPELLTGSGVVRPRSADALLEVLRDGTVSRVLRRLLRLERGQLTLPPELTRRHTLLEVLLLRLIRHRLRGLRLTEVLPDGLIARRLILHRRLERRQLRLVAKLTGLRPLTKRLTLRLVFRSLTRKGVLEVLLRRRVLRCRGLLARAKARQSRLIGKPAQRLRHHSAVDWVLFFD